MSARRRKRWPRLLLWTAVALPLALFALLGGYLVLGDVDPPEDGDLLLEPLELSPGENGFELVEFAEGEISWEEDEYEMQGATPDDEYWDDALAERIAERNARFIDRLDEALARPEFVVPRLHYDDKIPWLMEWQDLAYTLQIRAHLRLRRAEVRGALEDALRLIRFGQRVKAARAPLVVYLVAEAVAAMGYHALGAVVSETSDPETLRQLEEELEALEPRVQWLIDCVKTEYASMVRGIEDLGIEPFTDLHNPPSLLERLLFQPNRAKSLLARNARATLEAVRRSEFREIYTVDPMFESFDATRHARAGVVWTSRWVALAERTLHRLARALIALRLYHLEEGELPEALEELVPPYLEEVPLDPWDEKPLRYSGEDRVVYSVGEDLVDSGGADPDTDLESDDVALRFEFGE